MFYERIIAEALSTPWAILPSKLSMIQHFLQRKAKGETIPDTEIAAARESRTPPRKSGDSTVAVVPIHDTITHRASFMSDFSGGTNCETVGRMVDQLAADSTVKAIIFDVSSPGGTVFGVSQLGDKIREAGKSKPTIAVVNSIAASAAYWLACSAGEIVIAPEGDVGSIGVVMMTFDYTAAYAAEGIKPNVIKSSELKMAGNPYEPLSDAQRASIQKEVDDYYAQFIAAVAVGRRVPEATVRERFGQGATFRATEAVAIGMVDRIGTLDEVIAKYSGTTPATGNAGNRANLSMRKRKLLLN